MLIAFNKPYGVLSQFTDPQGRPTLADYIDQPGVYPAGRLDFDSEGLMLLTDDGALQAKISAPGQHWPKTYLAQVEGIPSAAAIAKLRKGLRLKDGVTQPAQAEVLPGKPGWLWPRSKPIAPRKGKPVNWLQLVLMEGRNRQVRRMTAAVGLPTLRLVRYAIGELSLDGLEPGQWRHVDDVDCPHRTTGL